MKHGTAKYRKGCRCADCMAATRAYYRDYRRHERAGEATSGDAGRTQAHIKLLLAAGMTYAGIARLAGLHRQTVRLAHLGHGYVQLKTSDAILGIAIDDQDQFAKVPAWKTQRLVSEMRRAGVSNAVLADVLKRTHKRGLYNLIGPERVAARTEARFITIYRYLAGQGVVPADVLEEIA